MTVQSLSEVKRRSGNRFHRKTIFRFSRGAPPFLMVHRSTNIFASTIMSRIVVPAPGWQPTGLFFGNWPDALARDSAKA